MRKIIVSTVFLFAFGTLAQAAPATPAQAVTGAHAGHKYWLSDDLNRLAFWKAPDTARSEHQTR